MKKKKITIMNVGTKEKPSKKEFYPHQKQENYAQRELDLNTIFHAIAEVGHSWRCGNYIEDAKGFGKVNITNCGLLGLDFDEIEATPQEVVEYAANIGLPINFWYYTFSQGIKKGNNFRIVWVLEEMISLLQWEEITKILMQETFAQYNPDKSCKDASRLWFGSRKGGEIVREDFITAEDLGRLEVISGVGKGKRHDKMKKSKKGFAAQYYKNPQKGGSYPVTKDNIISEGVKTPQNGVCVSKHWKKILSPRCPLFAKLLNNEKLNHNERVMLITNAKELTFAAHDKSFFEDFAAMFDWDLYLNSTFTYEELKRFWRDRSLKPYPIIYLVDGSRITLAEFFSRPEGVTLVIDKSDWLSLAELDAWMDTNVKNFLDVPEHGYFISQTGSGKTERIINYLKNNCFHKRKILLTAPTLALAEEIHVRCTLAGVKTSLAPKADYTDEDLRRMAMGAALKYGDDERRAFINRMYSDEDFGIYIVTHSLLANLGASLTMLMDLVIVDENIETELVKWNEITFPQLRTLHCILDDFCSAQLEKTLKTWEGEEEETLLNAGDFTPFISILENNIDEYLSKVRRDETPKNIFTIGDGKLYRTASGVTLHTDSDLFSGVAPVKIFTATPMQMRIAHLCPHMQIVKAPKAKNSGEIIHCVGVTGARGLDNSKAQKNIDYADVVLTQEEKDNAATITFKNADVYAHAGYKLATLDGTQIHLANCRGLDCFKGSLIVVMGKFDFPHSYYKDAYRAIGGDVVSMTRQNQEIELCGEIFSLYLYTEERLRQMQLESINFYTEQAAGRARALREETAKVFIINNVPTPDADKILI